MEGRRKEGTDGGSDGRREGGTEGRTEGGRDGGRKEGQREGGRKEGGRAGRRDGGGGRERGGRVKKDMFYIAQSVSSPLDRSNLKRFTLCLPLGRPLLLLILCRAASSAALSHTGGFRVGG